MNEENQLGNVFNRAETEMGTDMYNANVDAMKAHIALDTERSKMYAGIRASFSIVAIGAIISLPGWMILLYKWAFNA